jgi:putative hydrolase of the HAD superfamily
VYAAVAARHGLHDIPVDTLNRQFAAAWKNLTTFNYTRPEWFEVVNQSFAGLTPTPLNETLFADLYSHFGHAEAWRIFDDVIPALESLRSRGLKVGIISNWDERLRPLLHQLNLDHFFQTIVVSCESSHCKPSPIIFKYAAQLLGFPPASILHIGDHAVLDRDGATSAGFQSLLLARGPAKPGQLNSLALLDSVLFPM